MSQEAQYKESIFQHLGRLYNHITPRRRWEFGLLLVLMVLASISEAFSIGAVLPFLTVITSPKTVYEYPLAQPFINFLGLSSSDQLLLPLTIVFVLAAIVAGALRLFLLFVTTKLAYSTGSDLTYKVYRATLYQPYSVHISRNSSEVINSAVSKINAAIQSTIIPVLTIFSSIITLLFILFLLITVKPIVTLISISTISLIYLLLGFVTKKRLSNYSATAAKKHTEVVKLLQEGLGGIRDILLDGTQEIFSDLYKSSDVPLRKAQGKIAFIAISPRFAVEAFAMSFLAIVAYFIAGQTVNVSRFIPIIGILAMGAQRLLPLIQQIYASRSSIVGARASVADTLILLDQTIPKYVNQNQASIIAFDKHICIKDLSYSYVPAGPLVLNNINLKIVKGSTVGFIGETGSGKSTLLDVIMGLLLQTSGTIEIDDVTITHSNFREWQKHIAHVPQSVFLIDSTIEENIAFGIPKNKIDKKRISLVASKAQISDSIECLPLQYQEIVGERGVKYSGGERQRIGIARAFYKNVDVIIFDEATSALDDKTEVKVMNSISKLGDEITTLIVAHRLSTLKLCDQIFELADGKIIRTGSYNDIISI